MMCWQAAWADLKAGWPEIEGLMPMATDVPLAEVVTFGSGKLLTPCLRMHAENWNADAGPPCALAAAPDTEADDGELPPHPAAITATMTAARNARQRENREERHGIGVITGHPLRRQRV